MGAGVIILSQVYRARITRPESVRRSTAVELRLDEGRILSHEQVRRCARRLGNYFMSQDLTIVNKAWRCQGNRYNTCSSDMDLFWRQLASLLGPSGPIAPQQIWLPSPQIGERRMVLRASQVLNLSRLDALLSGGSSPSVSVSLRSGTDASAAGTAITSSPVTISSTNGGSTTGTVITSFQSTTVPVDHWLWLDVIAVSGSPAGLTVSVRIS